MNFDENKKVDVEISENDFVENRVQTKRKFSNPFKNKNIDLLDLVIVPVTIGVFISLGFLFMTLFQASDFSIFASEVSNAVNVLI